MVLKYSDLFEKIEESDWEYELKWEMCQEKYFSELKKLKMCCILDEPKNVIFDQVGEVEHFHSKIKSVYLWFKTSEEFTNNCSYELIYFKGNWITS